MAQKPTYSNYNQYTGLNAHLQSKLQQPNGGWSMFHHQHINAVAIAVNEQLPPDYYATTEDSLQIATRSEQDALTLQDQTDSTTFPGRPTLLET